MRKIFIKLSLISKYINKFGIQSGILVFATTLISKGIARIKLPNIKHPFFLRRDSSDIQVFNQVFLDEEYRFKLNYEPKVIIDCGANIGLTTLFFREIYPNAKIIAIEPEETNFQMLLRNVSPYDNIHCIKAGLWNKKTKLKIENASDEKWSFTCVESYNDSDDSFDAVSLNSIITSYGLESLDIVKIDIEGSELEVFSDHYKDWLSITKTIMIELHDYKRRGCSKSFFKAVLDYDFSLHVGGRGHTILLTKN